MNPLFWGLDPLFWTNVKLFIKDILNLTEVPDYKDIFTFFDHHIRYTQLCGVIVAVEQTSSMMIYTVDDGSGVLPCVRWKDNIKKREMVNMGDCVRITGRIATYNGTRQVKIFDLAVLTDPNWELLFNLEIMALRRDHYSKPFRVPTRITQHEEELKRELEMGKDTLPMVLSEDVKQNFENSLLSYLETKFGTTTIFTLVDLQSDPDVHDLARLFLPNNEQGPTHMIHQIKTLLSRAFYTLKEEGNFISTSIDEDQYILFNDRDLELEILNVIRSTLDTHGRHNLVGVNHKYICYKVQERFKELPTKKISKCIYGLDENSIIYRTDAVGRTVELCDYRIMDDV
ncbi:hypothetical protein BCR42DRAFT_162666 [Absidia repens]|uniref:CST complex subunit STN1 n=1 Tax=Absidia repens TaxID=90262 RepID=A0A1X2ITM2_9FUNG|nr:hypothetical protein BCR42DRAFT_162666 [Absidia repens]